MPKKHLFTPHYRLTHSIVKALMRIEATQKAVSLLPITGHMLAKLRETSRYQTVHYSTMIEGNRLTQEQVVEVIKKDQMIPGRERDEKEVRGYYKALEAVQKYVAQNTPITQDLIKTLHALVIAGGKVKVKPSPYRESQNVIKESGSGRIVYMPPEAKDVPELMQDLVAWISEKKDTIPCPIIAAIAHYQFATIHPYLDGNGRTARLLATLLVHQGGYDLKGIYSLDEYYARDIQAYYDALTIGPSHNYYMGREEADITQWVEYFCVGMADAFDRVELRARQAAQAGAQDQTGILRELSKAQRQVLALFQEHALLTSNQIAQRFGIADRTARNWCTKWVQEGFLEVAQPARKGRMYRLAKKYEQLVT
ncbi:MAG: Fic family protein [Candidatus Babeliales bacterium]